MLHTNKKTNILFTKSTKKILLVFANIFVSTVIAFTLAYQAGNLTTDIDRFLNPQSWSWATGLLPYFLGIPIFYTASVFFFAKLFAKESVKENIILSLVLPPIIAIVIFLSFKLVTV